MPSISCPHCGEVVDMANEQAEAWAGRTMQCARCRGSFIVPVVPVDEQEVMAALADDQPARPPLDEQIRGSVIRHNGLEYARPRPRITLADYFAFRVFTLVSLVQWVFVAGSMIFLLVGVLRALQGLFWGSVFEFMWGLFLMIAGPALLRLGCEIAVLILRSYETMVEVRELMQKERM